MKKIGRWTIKLAKARNGDVVADVETGVHSDRGSIGHDGVMRFDFPERIPMRVKEAAYRMVENESLRSAKRNPSSNSARSVDLVKKHGRVKFSDRMKRMSPSERTSGPRWTAFVSIFGHDVAGHGNTKPLAIEHALDELPEHLRHHVR